MDTALTVLLLCVILLLCAVIWLLRRLDRAWPVEPLPVPPDAPLTCGHTGESGMSGGGDTECASVQTPW